MSDATVILKRDVLDKKRKKMQAEAIANTGDENTNDLWAEDVPTRVCFENMDEDCVYMVVENEFGYFGIYLDMEAFVGMAKETRRMKEYISSL